MTILLMRHGETEWNVAGRKQGRGNSGLTKRGRKQVHEYCEVIDMLSIDIQRIFVSPLGRAQDSCDIVSSVLNIHPKIITTADELAELDFGEWQGLTDKEIDQQFPGERDRRKSDHWNYQIQGGESYSIVEDRIAKWWNGVDLSNSLLIAHEMVNRVILGMYQGLGHAETLAIKHPHGKIYRLNQSAIECIDCSHIITAHK